MQINSRQIRSESINNDPVVPDIPFNEGLMENNEAPLTEDKKSEPVETKFLNG